MLYKHQGEQKHALNRLALKFKELLTKGCKVSMGANCKATRPEIKEHLILVSKTYLTVHINLMVLIKQLLQKKNQT